MVDHTLPKGVALIESLAKFGRSLGYVAHKEYAIDRSRLTGPAVDLAWLSDKDQVAPLMIFEIESRATSSAANNAVKVFSQDSTNLLKPLFFFHLFIRSGQETSRVDDLRRMFGTHNYRTYELSRPGAFMELLKDILAQHRRVRSKIKLSPVLEYLNQNARQDIELNTLLTAIEDLRFEADYLGEYATYAARDADYIPSYVRVLQEILTGAVKQSGGLYDSYLGTSWHRPIHLGILACACPSNDNWLARLKEWQEESSFQSMIGPHFGLSADYDDFVLGIAPPLLGLMASLMQGIDGAPEYICDQLRIVVDSACQGDPDVWLFSAFWAMLISAAMNDEARFQYFQTLINQSGGMPGSVLREPPGFILLHEDCEVWEVALAEPFVQVPSRNEFVDGLVQGIEYKGVGKNLAITIALESLLSDRAIEEWSPAICESLFCHEQEHTS